MAVASVSSSLLSRCLLRSSPSSCKQGKTASTSPPSFAALSRSVRCRAKCTAFFKIGGQNAESAGIFASQGRDDYSEDDVALYFDYSGMLATEGSYDKMKQMLSQGLHPADLLLLMAASEGDRRKIEELVRAGARWDVKDLDGKTALDRACDEETRDYIQNGVMLSAA